MVFPQPIFLTRNKDIPMYIQEPFSTKYEEVPNDFIKKKKNKIMT